jgi:rSAM/selenodomain-associated transferase 1
MRRRLPQLSQGGRDTAVIVFAKPPIQGEVKTRLASAIGAEWASSLARAFIEDTWSLVRRLPWADSVLATTRGFVPDIGKIDPGRLWPQGDGDLGQRIERVMQRALARRPSAIALGADTPGLPVRLLDEARAALRRADAVLGPADDGGFYLLGLRRCPPGLLVNLPWGERNTFERTHSRLQQSGLEPVFLERWFDVDRWEDLRRLGELLDTGAVVAPATHDVLRRFRRATPPLVAP